MDLHIDFPRAYSFFIIISVLLISVSGIGSCLAGGLEAVNSLNSSRMALMPLSLLQKALSEVPAQKLRARRFSFSWKGQIYTASTTMEQELQVYLDGLIDNALGATAALICLDPVSGRIIAMSGFDRNEPLGHVWTDELIPSASIFKIVTAAGTIELFQMTPGTVFYFNGGKHTLYKYQLKEKRNKYSNRVTLKDAFAQSINPVFGKIGSMYLKRDGLEEMSIRFLWGRHIPFELPIKKSTIFIGDDSFNWAEVASGFNKKTRITLLHAALIASAAINHGVVMAPRFIDTVRNASHAIVYQSRIYPIVRPINPRTADFLIKLMIATVRSGTARKAFRGFNRDNVLKNLIIGGKTGTIDNISHDLSYDWFVGFAKRKGCTKCLIVAAVVAHEDVLGTRAARYARLAIRKYFQME